MFRGLNNFKNIKSVGIVISAIFSGFATAIALGITSENTIIKKDITMEEIIVPASSPRTSINKLVAKVVHKVLAILLPISNVLMTLSLIFMTCRTSAARLLPSDFNLCNFPGAEAVIAVSVADIRPAIASKHIMMDTTIKNIIYKKLFTEMKFSGYYLTLTIISIKRVAELFNHE